MESNYIIIEDFIVELGAQKIYFYKNTKAILSKDYAPLEFFNIKCDCYMFIADMKEGANLEKIQSPKYIENKYFKYFRPELEYKLEILLKNV